MQKNEEKIGVGISNVKAEQLLNIGGKNELLLSDKKSVMKIFAGQFKDVMVIILLIATAVSGFLGEFYDSITIITIVLLNAILGFIQEFKTEKTLETLKNLTAPTAKVYRDGILRTIKASEMVIGDVFEIESGDRVPCDALILSQKSLFADESILTGEAVPAQKCEVKTEKKLSELNQPYIAYMGTSITRGNARCQAFATGMSTQMGKVSSMIGEIKEKETPLQKKLSELGKIVALICIIVCVIVFVAGILRGEELFSMLMTGITVAIAAIPEGLPATVTIALALAVRRMLKQKALVNRLHSVETLGCASVICSDKTGTITENKMCVSKIYCCDDEFDVSGTGYKIFGQITSQNGIEKSDNNKVLEEILLCATLCNNAKIHNEYIQNPNFQNDRNYRNILQKSNWDITGDPTEAALLVASHKGGLTQSFVENNYERKDEIPFESDTRMMSVLVKSKNSSLITYAKGSIDAIISRCDKILTNSGEKAFDYKIIKKVLAKNDELASLGLRVLAFCCADEKSFSSGKNMTFLGLIAMSDPPRIEAKKAIKRCEKAGIKTVMITGDHKLTAVCVAKESGIFFDNSLVVTGQELANMDENRLDEIIDNVSVFARVNPSDKLRIVRAFKKKNHIVAMTGDGVNDAPSIKEADIGVSMGQTGTDVAKQAADLILLDDNFATLVLAVEQGRAVYANIRRFVRYLLSCNIGEVITMFLGIIMGFPMVLLPIQLLLVNLLTDGLPAIALGLEKPEKNIMNEKPRNAKESFFSGGLMSKIFFRGIFIGLCTLGCFSVFVSLNYTLTQARTASLCALILSQLIHVFECKSERKNIFTVNYFSNPFLLISVVISLLIVILSMYFPPLQLIFSTTSLDKRGLLLVLAFSFAIPILSAIFKKNK